MEQTQKKYLTAEEAEKKYPGPSQFVHLHNHTLFSILDGVAQPEQYFKGCVDRDWPAFAITEHGVLNSVSDAYFAAKEHKRKYIVGCFLPSQDVFGKQVKHIDQIKDGDFVLSRDNCWQTVRNVQVRSYQGDIRRIKAWCVEDIVCTPEHPLLVREVTRSETKRGVWQENITVGFRQASELFREKYWRTYATKRSQDRNNKRRYRFYLCVPRLKPGSLSRIDCGTLIKSDNHENILTIVNDHIESVTYKSDGYKTTKRVNLPCFLQLDCELLWIMGLWLAEGTISDGGLNFTLCSDEMNFVDRLMIYFSQYNIKVSYNLREDRNVIDVNVYSRWFGRIFERLLGKYFDGKRINDKLIFGLNYDQTESLLEGLFDGDAKRTEYSSYLKLTNKTLIWQARLLMTRLGQYSAISETPNNNSDNISYSIRYRESGHFYYDLDEDYIYLPIYKVEDEQYQGPVYNLETEGDHTYNVGTTVHNCEVYFNDYEPLRRDRLTSGWKMTDIKKDDEELAMRMTRNRHLTVLCKNMTGYMNLLEINKQAWEFGFYYRPRVWFDLLAKYHEGLIILSGCLNGPVCHELRMGNLSSNGYVVGAVDYINKFHKVFGEDYYIELQMPCIQEINDVKVFRQLVAIADKKGIKTVISNDCWFENTPVLTNAGTKFIKNVQVGDMVWTHRGRLREVMCVGKRKLRQDEELYGFLGGKLIYCTGNHKLFSRRNINTKPDFRTVDSLETDDFVCIPQIKIPKCDLEYIFLSDYITSTKKKVRDGKVYPYGRAKVPISDCLKLTDDILYLIGAYIAEGSVDSYRLSFASHKREQASRNLILKQFESLGLTPQEKKISENGYRVRICCSAFSYFLKDVCGHRAYVKHLPSFWTKLSHKQLIILLRGYLDGDGSHSCRTAFTTSSMLISDLLHAFSSLGLIVSAWLRKPKDKVVIKKKDGQEVISKLNEGYYLYCPKPTYSGLGYNVGSYDKSKSRLKSFFDNYGLWIKNPFKQIGSFGKDVWCMQVDEDSSFLTTVASSNCHYLDRRDFQTQKIMMAISQGTTVDDPNLFHVNSSEQYFKTRHELRATFQERGYGEKVPLSVFEQACDNSLEIADKCDTFKPNMEPKLPRLKNAEQELIKLCNKALIDKGHKKDKNRYLVDGREVTYAEQTKIELERFIKKGFASYFLITRDLIKCSHDNDWPLGPARGSAGGSLVCYLLGIQSLDPLKWGTSFNRFLSPSRGGYMLKVTM